MKLPSTIYISNEPEFLMRLNKTEFITLSIWSLICAIFITPLSLIFYPLGLKVIPITLIVATIVFAITRHWIVSVKRNKPDGYYVQKVQIFLAKAGLGNKDIIAKKLHWDYYRH